MSIPLTHETTRRQLPRGPSCQCHALLSYKPRPRPVFRPDAPVESVEELCDEVFRIGTSILIRLAVPVPPAQMAYFECLNGLDAPQYANPERKPHEYDSSTPCPEHGSSLVAGELREDSQPPGSSDGREDPSADPNAQGSLPTPYSDVPLRESLPELLYPRVDSDAARPLIDQVPPVSGPRPETVSEAQDNAQHRLWSNPIVRYVTKEQLKAMGWKDLFKLARVSLFILSSANAMIFSSFMLRRPEAFFMGP